MLILGIDTSTTLCGVVLLEDGHKREEGCIGDRRSHSNKLMPLVHGVLQRAGIRITDVDAFAAALGPGSFTGIRIGLSVVKGFSMAASRPAVGVPTLDAMSRSIPLSGVSVCPVIDARKGQVYTALFKHVDGGQIKLTPDMVLDPEELVRYVKEPAVFFGSGLPLYSERIKGIVGEERFRLWDGGVINGALGVALIGWRKLMDARGGPIAGGLDPIYVRRAEAEINWERKRREREKGKT